MAPATNMRYAQYVLLQNQIEQKSFLLDFFSHFSCFICIYNCSDHISILRYFAQNSSFICSTTNFPGALNVLMNKFKKIPPLYLWKYFSFQFPNLWRGGYDNSGEVKTVSVLLFFNIFFCTTAISLSNPSENTFFDLLNFDRANISKDCSCGAPLAIKAERKLW